MTMLSHAQIWAALDRLAARAGLSPSGLAKKAGLDPTTFNKSKRITPDGRARWPSTESVAKSLNATGVTIEQFLTLITEGAPAPARSLPLIALTAATGAGYFDENGFPTATGWDEIAFPAVEDEHAYALEIAGDSLEPIYRDGTLVLVSPAAPIRRNDRVVVKMRDGEVVVVELRRKTAKTVELKPLHPAQPERSVAAEDVLWLARIVWASQ
jgi:phage repressor protein C with HTH and peptisase S24 domain